ncbi:tRNA pseudouridine(38-40) synthase [Chthonomonas calidirosea]|uniref:tRNA pseudouridine(38-40) synthase TruA n=1 Tax=Chthonomonas calidirosea TaxID=454171 RepID=UPI0006DD41CD|nr:tRNA pseudouridine(38-40) synthase TruA [Chthonomonas calidirosea]CEK15504.1 tRNA pseudouridine(38-40) synthase [Chthonomonas calidirosea]
MGRLVHVRAVVEYDGTDFSGFQRQRHARTVQEVLEEAIAKRLGQPLHFACAGRTDAGVHALGQVVSFDCETRVPSERMAVALNSVLPPDVCVKQAEEVDPSFHARYSASSRVYLYVILNRSTPSALLHRYSAFCSAPLDVEAMRKAGNCLLGEHDFASFANELLPGEPAARELMACHIRRRGELVTIRVEANAFLRGMVRTIVGTLMEIGKGKRAWEDVPCLLAARDRRLAGPTAPPQGLFLLHVRYGQRKRYGEQKDKDSCEEYGE